MADPLLSRVAAIARRAGDLALGLSPAHGARPRIWEKTPGHPVTDADLAVDSLLRAELGALLPDAGWLSEETLDHPARLDCARIWCVDPIDGTRDFIRGRPGWAVSIALIDAGLPRLGILYAPVSGLLWQAEAGGGASCNGAPCRASQRLAFAGARVPTDSLPAVDRDLAIVSKPNSIALRMAMVANDEADLVATLRWGHEWDVAAAALIVAEAGGMVSDAHGMPLSFNAPSAAAFGVIACAPGLHAAAVARLAERAAALDKGIDSA